MHRFLLSIIIILAIMLSSCKEEKIPASQVRFSNNMSDRYEFPYGLMLGDAIYGNNLVFKETTPYLETKPGVFSLLARRVDGEWIEISEKEFEIFPGHKYTITFFGTVEKISFQFLKD